MKNTCVFTWLICCFVFHSKNAEGYYATSTTVLLAQAKGVVPYAYGPVKTSVSASRALTLDFSIVAGTGYAAGAVRATTDSKGRVVRLVKQNQACAIKYNSVGSIGSVRCTGARLLLTETDPTATINRNDDVDVDDDDGDDDEFDDDDDDGLDAERESGEDRKVNRKTSQVARRSVDVLPCASCASLVYSTFNSRIKSVCGTPFSRLIPLQYRWPKTVAAALCGMTMKLGDHVDLAYRTCRCCIENSDCPSGVCSAGACLPRRIPRGEPCPDFEDGDCENSRCALDSYPMGKHVCCPSNKYIPHPDTVTSDYYCSSTQAVGALCTRDEMCNDKRCARGSYPSGELICCPKYVVYSATYNATYCARIQQVGAPCDDNDLCVGICSAGFCLPGRIGPGLPCPDREADDCSTFRCGRELYPAGGYVCCNETVHSYEKGEIYCRNQRDGSLCENNEMCSSGVCSFGVCLGQHFRRGDPCPEMDSSDCENSNCARGSYPSGEYVCCPSSGYFFDALTKDRYCEKIKGDGTQCDIDKECSSRFCIHDVCLPRQEVGSLCMRNIDCLSNVCSDKICLAGPIRPGQRCPDRDNYDCENYACGRDSYPSGNYVCCPSNGTFYADSFYCNGIMGVGSSCRTNLWCSSGVCSGGSCSNGECYGGVCLAQPLGIGEPCPDKEHGDCASRVCAQGSYPWGAYVCCAGNASARYCVQGIGASCGFDSMCASGKCSGGVCVGKQLGSGMLCGSDAECESGSCALGAYKYPYEDYICCDGTSTLIDGLSFCTNQEAGSSCTLNECCLSGVCSDSICLTGPISTGELCPDGDDRDCENNACGRLNYPFGIYICCINNRNVYDDIYQEYYCTGHGEGSWCNSDELCASGVCLEGVCI
jgi:hypothetical protein